MKTEIENQIKTGGLSPEGLLVMAVRGAAIAILLVALALGCSEQSDKAANSTLIPTADMPQYSKSTALYVGLTVAHTVEHASITVTDITPGTVTCSIRINGTAQIVASISKQHFQDVVLANSDWQVAQPNAND